MGGHRKTVEPDRKQPVKPRTDNDIESEGDAISRSQASVRSRTEGGGASLIQVDVGVSRFAAILLFVTAIISAAAFVGLLFTMSSLKTVSAQYQVLQYDHQALKAQLVAKGIYEGTEH